MNLCSIFFTWWYRLGICSLVFRPKHENWVLHQILFSEKSKQTKNYLVFLTNILSLDIQNTLKQFMSLFFPNFIQILSKFYSNSILKLHKLTWTSLTISIKKMLLMVTYLLVKLQPKISLNHNVQSQTNQKIDRQVRLYYFDDTAKVCKTSCISCFQMLRIKNS